MKTLSMIICISLACISAKAQLTNTRWKVSLDIPDPTDVVFNFKTDTVDVTSAADSERIETMIYSIQADTVLILQKVTGQSECDSGIIGKYAFRIRENQMYLSLMEDACDDRSNALNNNEQFTKIE